MCLISLSSAIGGFFFVVNVKKNMAGVASLRVVAAGLLLLIAACGLAHAEEYKVRVVLCGGAAVLPLSARIPCRSFGSSCGPTVSG